VATRQEIVGAGQGLLHPSLLSTLVYRFGIPGGTARSVDAVQANGQCFLARTELLRRSGGFTAVQESLCEDVTLGRRLVAQGVPLGFFEAGELVTVRMYPDWHTLWRNWPRSLPMRDRYFGLPGALGLVEVLLVQSLPLPLLGLLAAVGDRAPRWAKATNTVLAATRLGVLAGTARAYRRRPPTYWLSPLADLPAAITLIASALRRRHSWRGRALVRGLGDAS
jgi:dolichol-phosphate mannosyltransferase